MPPGHPASLTLGIESLTQHICLFRAISALQNANHHSADLVDTIPNSSVAVGLCAERLVDSFQRIIKPCGIKLSGQQLPRGEPT